MPETQTMADEDEMEESMRAWVKKDAAIAATTSGWVKGWLSREHKVAVPCTIQMVWLGAGELKPEHVWAQFTPKGPAPRFRLQIPFDSVRVEHRLVRHSVPWRSLPLVQQLMRDINRGG